MIKHAPAFALCLGCVTLAGCATLPKAGPSVNEVLEQQVVNNQRQFDVVDVDQHVVNALRVRREPSFHERFRHYGKPPSPRIGVGDSISVSLWEAASGGLLSAAPAAGQETGGGLHSVTIPVQVVGPDGSISVPYAGRVRAAGRLPAQVQKEIENRLAAQAIQPQAIVTVSKTVNDTATVLGEVVKGAQVPLSSNGERLLDLIAAAGGVATGGNPGVSSTGNGIAPIFDLFVKLSRHGVTVTIPLDKLVSDPAENIYAWPGDVLTVVSVPQTFVAFGAAGNNARIDFGSQQLNLAQAIAEAHGLVDQQADPSGVFLFRYEPPKVVAALHAPELGTGPDRSSPVIYRLDLQQAKSFFLARLFPVRNGDIIYVANAPLTQVQKFFTLINTLSGPIVTGYVIKNSTP